MTDSTKPGPDADRIAESISRRISECKWEIEQYDHICNMHVAGSEQYDTAWQAKQVTLAELSRLRNEQPKGGDGLSEAQWLKNCEEQRPAMEAAETQFFDELKRRKPFEDALCNVGYDILAAEAIVSVLADAGLLPSHATSPEPKDVRDIARKYAAVIAKEANELGARIGDDLISPIASEIGNAIREAALAQQAPDAVQLVADGEFVRAAMRVMRANPGFNARDYEDGITADDFENFFTEDVNEAWRNVERLQEQLSNTAPPRSDAVREALLEDGIRNLCYTAFQRRTSGRNSDDGGECDWMNDTLPIIERGIKNLLACTPAPSANEIERLTKERDEARADSARLYEEGMDIVERWKRLLFDTCPQIIANKEAAESALAKANARIAELEASERPAPSASAGLIAAAELAEREASSYEATANNSFVHNKTGAP